MDLILILELSFPKALPIQIRVTLKKKLTSLWKTKEIP